MTAAMGIVSKVLLVASHTSRPNSAPNFSIHSLHTCIGMQGKSTMNIKIHQVPFGNGMKTPYKSVYKCVLAIEWGVYISGMVKQRATSLSAVQLVQGFFASAITCSLTRALSKSLPHAQKLFSASTPGQILAPRVCTLVLFILCVVVRLTVCKRRSPEQPVSRGSL